MFHSCICPPDFDSKKFAESVGNARILAVGPNGNVYVTRREEGDVLMFRVGADGLAGGQSVRVASRSRLHGFSFSKGKVYRAAVHEIFKTDFRPDGSLVLWIWSFTICPMPVSTTRAQSRSVPMT
jgi:hypothetical protein